MRQALFFLIEACNFIKKETLAHELSCEFSEISKNIFFYRALVVAASGPTILNCFIRTQHLEFIMRKTRNKSL